MCFGFACGLESDPIAPPVGTQTTGLTYRISTFKPQIAEVSLQVLDYLGFTEPDNAADKILNTDAVRQLCAMGTIMVSYISLAAICGER